MLPPPPPHTTHTSPPSRIVFLDGLRGLAILMVVMFHMYPSFFLKGYLGVDVFFVISGYFLSKGYNKKFEFLLFIRKKILRIFPLIIIAIILSGIIMSVTTYSLENFYDYTRSSISSLLCCSNIWYTFRYADYFAVDSNLNPLLHTWFLSCIVQFYLIFAIMGFLLKNCKQNIRVTFCIALFVLSFFYAFQHVINIFHLPIIGGSAKVSYYDPFGRMWEVLAGGMVGLLPRKDLYAHPKIVRALIILLSTSLVVMSFICNTDECLVILTVLLTVLIIGMEKITFLENKILCYIGKISYPLYLIHFPLIVACVRWNFARPSLLVSILLLIIIFVLALFLNVHVENKNFSIRSIFVSLILGLVCLCSFHKFGCSNFFISDLQHIEGYKSQLQDVDERFNRGYDGVLLRGNGGTQSQLFAAHSAETKNMLMLGNAYNEPEFLLIGDSNAQHLFSGIDIICKNNHISGIHLTTTIMPFPGLSYYHDATYYWNYNKYEAFLSWLKGHASLHTVFISQAWLIKLGLIKEEKDKGKCEDFIQELRRFCVALNEMGKNVVLVNPGPHYLKHELLPKCDAYVVMRKRRGLPIDLEAGDDPAVIDPNEYCKHNAEILSFFNELENEQICRVLHIEKGIFCDGNFSLYMHGCLYMHDGVHLTPRGSIYIMNGVKDEFLEYIDSGRKKAKEKEINLE